MSIYGLRRKLWVYCMYDVSVRAIKQQIYRIFNDRECRKKAALFYLGHLMEFIVMDDG